MKMFFKRNLILILLVIFTLIIAYCGMVIGWTVAKDKLTPMSEWTEDLLSGSSLQSMMNEDKYSPGVGEIYATDHPDYAWLFDDSFVTYVDD